MSKRVAIITHELSLVGGLPTMISFLRRTLINSRRYEVNLISLATSVSDEASLALTRPQTWRQGARIETVPWHDLSFTHVGVWGSELEFQRYQPRRKLTELLQRYDLLQFVAGSPPWVCVARDVKRPIFLWTATTTRADRASQMRRGSFGRRAWASMMVPLTERFERRGLEKADAVFVLSEYTRRTVASISGRKDVQLAPCGVDTDLFHPATDVDRGGDYIVCVARFSDPRKNVRLLLDAYAKLHQQAQTVPDLYLIGDPPTAEAQSYLRQLGIGDKVRLIEPKRGEELAQLFRRAQFFALSSDEEGLGIVILEAMASGLPVVSTACGGPATAVVEGGTGFLTPVGDVDALAAALQRLVSDPELRARMGAAGRRAAVERFSLAAAGKVFLDRYDEALAVNEDHTRQMTEMLSSKVSAVAHDLS
jgi:glycosyltransferase involved in cell wall biosynthesis